MDLSSAKYRIAYEAFSQFSGKLSKVESIDGIAKILKKDLKYLFDYKLFRIFFTNSDEYCIFTFFRGRYWIESSKAKVFSYERNLLIDGIPFCVMPDEKLFAPYLGEKQLLNPLLWGWNFNYTSYRCCVSVIADDQKNFNQTDVQILNLLVDNIATKFQQVIFKDKLEVNIQNLKEAVSLIEDKNKQINEIVDNQKAVIAARTKEIRAKNNKLMDISRMNAHNVREPLSRILGLVDIAEHYSPEELHDEVLGYLKESALELDQTLQKIIEVSAGEIDKLSVE